MTSSSRRTLNKIRITVLWILVGLNFCSAVLIASAVDSIPLNTWPVWITFAANLIFLMLMAYANGWMYGTNLWWEREMMERGYTCTDCVYKNRCMERSRNYCCTSFTPKERKENTDDAKHRTGRDAGLDKITKLSV